MVGPDFHQLLQPRPNPGGQDRRMNYRIVHSTRYTYKHYVSIAEHALCLTPRPFAFHHRKSCELDISPQPSVHHERVDYFGNTVTLFTVQKPHRVLVVRSKSEVAVEPGARLWPERTRPWE